MAGGLPAARHPPRGARRAAPALARAVRRAARAPRRVARALAQPVDLSRLGGRGGRAGHPARLPLRARRLPRQAHPLGSAHAPRRPAAARRRARLPLPVGGERLRGARRAGGPPARRGAVAAHRRAGHPARPCVFDVRVLLPLHPRRAAAARPQPRRGGGRARRRDGAHALARDAAGAASGARGRGPAHLPHRAGLVLGAVPLRRRLSRHDDAGRRLAAQRQRPAGHGRVAGPRAARAARARGVDAAARRA